MIPKIRNIIIFVAIAAIFVFVYIYFIKPSGPIANLISSPATNTLPDVNGTLPTLNTSDDAVIAEDFLTLLLSVKSIKLTDNIFADPAFISLHDSSIVLIQDGTEGRPNPFADFGNNNVPPPVSTINRATTPPPATSTTKP